MPDPETSVSFAPLGIGWNDPQFMEERFRSRLCTVWSSRLLNQDPERPECLREVPWTLCRCVPFLRKWDTILGADYRGMLEIEDIVQTSTDPSWSRLLKMTSVAAMHPPRLHPAA